MRMLLIGALIAAQLAAAAPPAMAAELDGTADQRIGAFGGLRVRVPLDGDARQRQVRAGLALAPTLHTRTFGGESRLRIGQGLELGVRGREPVRLSIAGQDLRRLAAQDEGDDDGGGFPTWVLVAGGIAVVTAAGLLILIDSVNDSSD